MSTALIELPPAPGAAAWQRARGASALMLALALASLSGLVVVDSGQAFGVRADPVGAVVGLLLAFFGWVIVRYAQPYLAGERGSAPQRREPRLASRTTPHRRPARCNVATSSPARWPLPPCPCPRWRNRARSASSCPSPPAAR